VTTSLFRRGGRALVDDAVDRVRGDVFAFALLHVLPSLPFLLGALVWFTTIDLRGAMPDARAAWLPLLLLPKLLGWGALSAWAGAAARGRPCGVGAAWLVAVKRLPETAFAGALYLLATLVGLFTFVGFAGVPVALTALAASVSDAREGAATAVRRARGAATDDLGRSFAIMAVCALAWAFVALNMFVLPTLLLALGAGGFGVDLSLPAAALGIDRAATWALAALSAWMLLDGVLVVAFAELQRDREAEREGTRFEGFAEELESRAAAGARVATERVA